MPGILGLSPYKTPIQVWESKVNPGSVPELDKECLWFGNALEPIIRQRYAMKFGAQVVAPADIGTYFPNSRRFSDQTIVVGREPWMLGTADGWMPASNCGLEVKNVGRKNNDEWGDDGTDEIPSMYFAQVHWYCDIHKAKAWNVAPLFAGNTLGNYQVKFDDQFAKDMYDAARSFWFDNIVKRVEPPIDQSESYGKYLARKFSLNTGRVITSPDAELIRWASEMKSADDKVKEATELKTLANNHLRALVGDAQKAITPLGTVGWVRPEEKAVVDWKGFALACNRPDLQPKFESKKQNEAFLRAWWKK